MDLLKIRFIPIMITVSIGVDISHPPRFDCEKCDGKMVPIHHISVNGIKHTYKN